jgi:SAM-dependent methyltransferase
MAADQTLSVRTPRVRRMLKRIVPPNLISAVRLQRARGLVERALATAAAEPKWLSYDDLTALAPAYDFPAPYGYDSESLRRRGAERGSEIMRLPGSALFKRTLEFGCGDGMVSAYLARRGRHAIAVDVSAARFDPRAAEAGVEFQKSDAARTALENSSFDCVFSYNAFEHVADPEAVLAEMTRITRPGGIIYLSFGPLYWSAFGEHAYRSLPIPYCHCLFPLDTINRFCREAGHDEIDPHHVNRWSLSQYRGLWLTSRATLDRLRYRESLGRAHVDLIRRYPSCFRNRSTFALDFLIDGITAVFRKK